MSYLEVLNQEGGFNFDFYLRNKHLGEKGIQPPKLQKTGTTIVGCVYNGGVILAADTRASSGSLAVEKNCYKIHYLAPNIYCLGAGTAADCEFVTFQMASELELMRLNTGKQSRVSTAVSRFADKLFRYQGHIGAALIIGGQDVKGSHLVYLAPNGYCFAAMGSGSLAAGSILESKYKDDMTEQEAIDLCIEAIEAGITHDLGSGSNVDVCIVRKDTSEVRRNFRTYNFKQYPKKTPYNIPIGITPVLEEFKKKFEKIQIEEERDEEKDKDKMEVL